MSNLIPFWFIVIAGLWTGFFILEGFDFGVGILHDLVGTDDAGRRAGVVLGGLLQGLPINSSQNYTGSFWDLFQPYPLFTGITLVLVCALHGATFLGLKTTGDMRERSGLLARRVAPFTGAAVVGF